MSSDFEDRLRAARAGLPDPDPAASARAERAAVEVLRRGRFLPRWRRSSRGAAVIAFAALVIGVGGGFALGSTTKDGEKVAAAAPEEQPPVVHGSGGPGFVPAAGWNVAQYTVSSEDQGPSAVAANVPGDPRKAGASGELPRDGIVIGVTLLPPGTLRDIPIIQNRLPLTLDKASRSNLVPEFRGVFGSVRGWDLQVEIQFGVAEPSPKLVAQANAELARLVIPDRCPPDAVVLTAGDLPDARDAALAAAPRGTEQAGDVTLDYRARKVEDVSLGSTYSDYIRDACGNGFIAKTAVVRIRYPRIEQFGASLAQYVFLASKTPSGWVVWSQVH
jgi:hypothetical protein